MSVTAQNIFDDVATFLSLTSKSLPIAAEMPDGTGESTTPTVDGTTQVCLWITEAMERLARLCVPVTDTASSDVTAQGPSGIVGPFTEIQSSSNRTLYVPTIVSIDGNVLIATNFGFLNNTVWFPPTPEGNPSAWANSTSYIDLSYYTTTPTCTIQGYFLPIPIIDLTTPIDPFFDDFARLTVAYYVAWRVAAKNRDNAVLQAREVPCLNEFVSNTKEIYARLLQTDRSFEAIFAAAPVDSLVQVLKQVSPRT